MEHKDQLICLTCGNTDAGKFCSDCGERLRPRRISWNDILSDYWNDSLAFDTPFLGTIKHLVKRPGLFVRDYIKGTRTRFSRPMHFYLLILAVNYLVLVYLFQIETVLDAAQLGQAGMTEAQIAATTDFYYAVQEYSKLMVFMIMPFIAFYSWLFFRRSGHNYLENFVFVLFVSGIQLIINMIPAAFSSLIPVEVYSPVSLVFSMGMHVYFIWAMYQFKQQKTAGAVFKSIAAYVCGMVTYSALVVLAIYLFMSDQYQELINI